MSFDRLIAAGTARIERQTIGNQIVWIKRPEADKIKIWHHLQRVLAKFLPYEMLRPTVSRGGASTLQREIGKLVAFQKAGLPVPSVLHVTQTAFVVTDVGLSIRNLGLGKFDLPGTIDILAKAAATLGQVHEAGLAHGRPNLRDFTWNGERIGLIDLEEAPEAVMSLSAAQARDVWLLFIQLARYGSDTALERAWSAYRPFLTKDRVEKLQGFFRVLSPFITVFGKVLRTYGSRDVVSTLKATAFLSEKIRSDTLLVNEAAEIENHTPS